MKPILFELKRALTRKSLLVIIAVLIIVPASLTWYSISNTGHSEAIVSQASAIGSNGTYNVSIFLYEVPGKPVPQAFVNISVQMHAITLRTNNRGFANTTLQNVVAQSGKLKNVTYSFASYTEGSSFSQTDSIPIYANQSNPYFFIVTNGAGNQTEYSSRYAVGQTTLSPDVNGISIFYSYGGISNFPKLYVYYTQIPSNGTLFAGGWTVTYEGNLNSSPYLPNFATTSRSNLTFYGEYVASPSMVIDPYNVSGNSTGNRYLFEIFAGNGTLLGFTEIEPRTNDSAHNVSSVFYQDELPLISFFVPLMAILSAYQTFGVDLGNGTLSSIVARPISRKSLYFSRFAASSVTVVLSSFLSLGVSSLMFHYALGVYLQPLGLLLSFWSLAVMSCAFVGIVFLVTILWRTQKWHIVSILLITAIMLFMWDIPGLPILPNLISVVILNQPIGSFPYFLTLVRLDYLNPASFTNLTSYLIAGKEGSIIFGFFPSYDLGVSVLNVVLGGIIWIFLPVVTGFLLFIRRDVT